MSRAYVSLGSNLGDRFGYLVSAVDELSRDERVTVVRCSGVYETSAVGKTDQDPFLNCIVVLDTDLEPLSFLGFLREIENRNGRERSMHWGPRTLDADILLLEDLVIDCGELIVPHPRMTDRKFVVEPLLEIEPGICMPDGTPVSEFRDSHDDGQVVRLLPELRLFNG